MSGVSVSGTKVPDIEVLNVIIMNAPKIIFENETVIVVEKPSGLLVHPTGALKNVDQPTLVDFLLARYPEIKNVGEDNTRPGIVHRLDREVSGLIVVARTQNAYQELKHQFQKRTVEKRYLALVHGVIKKDEGVINFPIGRSRGNGRMAARPAGESGREARTEFTVLKRFPFATLLEVRLLTGRSHQIRAHFFGYGHPLIGDSLYSAKRPKLKRTPGRIFLHAATLAFDDLSSVRQSFTSPLPVELQSFLDAL